ncbi:MAG TPA: transposase [Phycisphaerales bacterium]|nr:transposase [Phycisphaerales bacterium]
MPRNVYWELFYHFVWHTKNNLPLITPPVQEVAYKFLIHRALSVQGAIVHAIGGIEDHVHMAVSLPPTVQLAEWVGDLKGACSHAVNHGPCGPGSLAWQTGYGDVSFGKRDLPWVLEYIRNQREHHGRGTAVDRLERITELEVEPEGLQQAGR